MQNQLFKKSVASFVLLTFMLSLVPFNPEPAQAADPVPATYGPFTNVTHTLTMDPGNEDLCRRNLTGVIEFDWPEATTMVDVVVIQDLSGSFSGTIGKVGDAIDQIASSLNMGTDIDGRTPKDRMMIVTYQGSQGTFTTTGTNVTSGGQVIGSMTLEILTNMILKVRHIPIPSQSFRLAAIQVHR